MSMQINDLYRTTEVKRWHITKVKRPQTVAEHSYIVGILTEHIVYALGLRDVYEIRMKALMFALYHDVSECVFGDVPGPVKKIIDYNKQMAPHEAVALGDYNSMASPSGEDKALIKAVVKLADLTESVKFLIMNKDSPHADTIYQKLWVGLRYYYDNKANSIFADAIRKHRPDLENQISLTLDDLWHKVILQFLHGNDYTIDDYLREIGITAPELGHGLASDSDLT